MKSKVGMTAAACVVFAGAMLGAAFASVPLYNLFCKVTGYGGTTQRAEAGPGKVLDRTVRVRFDANIGNGLEWSFRPVDREVEVKLGEIREIHYAVVNRSGAPSAATAVFNVTPGIAGQYFNKIACFCFNEQHLAAGEKQDMAVTFFVDPAMASDPELRYVDTITLSYTFFPAEDGATVKPLAAVPATKSPL